MSRLDELIKELCPNGVEYKSIADIFDTITDYTAAGSFKTIADNVKYYKEENYAQLIRTTDLKSNFLDKTNFVYVDENAFKFLWRVNLNENSLIMPNIGNCGEIYFVTKDLFPNENNVLGPNAILLKTKIYNIKYFYYYFHIKIFQKQLEKITSNTGQTKFNKTDLKKILVPVPPLEVQDEIVRILDTFTALTAELTAELTARRNQYSWYRDYLLKFENKIEIVKLGSVSNIVRGASPRPISNYITFEEDGINWIKIGDVNLESKYVEKTKEKITQEGAKKSRIVKKGDLILSNSMSFGRPYIVNQEGCIHDGWILISDYQTNYSTDFLYYLLMSNKVQKYMRDNVVSGTVQNLNIDIVKNIEIPLPPLEVQKRIVEVLDNFEKICNDLNIGLPAEIEARQKQYEFYRNILLTFNNEEIYALSKQASKQAQNLIKILQYVYGYVELELDKVANITMGVSPSGNSITDIKSEKNIEFHQGKTYFGETMLLQSNVYTNEPKKYAEKNSIVMSVRAPVGDTNMVNRKISIGRGLCSILADEKISLTKYLYYYIKSNVDKLKAMSNGSTFEAINSESIRKFTVSLPPLEEQQRIVDILDRFDKLCNDISEGLPAEIEARQKQYEYYREKLLTFKKL